MIFNKKNIKIMLFVATNIMQSLHCAPVEKQTTPQKEELSFTIENSTKRYSAIKCLLLCVGDNEILTKAAKMVKFDLEFTDQLDVEIRRSEEELNKKMLCNLFKQGTSLTISLKHQPTQKDKKREADTIMLHLKLHDTNAQSVIFEKSYTISEHKLVYDGHAISHDLLPLLTGSAGVTMSSLAYCKQRTSKHKVICIADYACKKETVAVPAHTLNVAPAWHNKAPFLFFSQFTRSNSRLMSLNLSSREQKVICSYDGLNMQPSFSMDGQQVALCLSGRSGNSEVFLYDNRLCKSLHKKVFKPLTNNHGNNASPCLLPNGNVIFCSDFETGNPQLYHLDTKHKKTQRLSNGQGYCAAPAYNAKINAVVYTKLINGAFQLFSLTFKEHVAYDKQLTFNEGDKLDPTWSACGRYVAFTYDYKDEKTKKKIPQIASLNCASGKIRILTSGKEPKSFAAWVDSPYYQG